MLRSAALMPVLLLAACAPQGPVVESPGTRAMTGDLDRVIGRDARQLTALFGDADQDVRAMNARRLRFAGPACVLDAYLYRKGGGEPVVTWIDTRTRAGSDIDRASCIAALSRRKAAR